MKDVDLILSVSEVLPWLKLKAKDVDNALRIKINQAIEDVLKLATVSFAYNLDVDLEVFEFKIYRPPFPLERLSLGCATLGEEIDAMFDFYSKKGQEHYRLLLESSANALVEKVVDFVNFVFCSSRGDDEKQSFRKSPGIGRVPIVENLTISDYLYLSHIGVKVNSNYSLYPKKTVIFFLEWADNSVEYHEFARRCNHCGYSPCIYRI